jgi:hypothetical protein
MRGGKRSASRSLTTIPLSSAAADPVKIGLVASLARRGNVLSRHTIAGSAHEASNARLMIICVLALVGLAQSLDWFLEAIEFRMLDCVEAGASQHEVERFEVSMGSAVRWMQTFFAVRSIAAKPGKASTIGDACGLASRTEHPDLTVAEPLYSGASGPAEQEGSREIVQLLLFCARQDPIAWMP